MVSLPQIFFSKSYSIVLAPIYNKVIITNQQEYNTVIASIQSDAEKCTADLKILVVVFSWSKLNMTFVPVYLLQIQR